MYEDSQLLMISGIQHYAFCKRQWALIHMEQQWHDNVYTVRGDIVHEKVDDPFIKESRGKHFVSRSLPVASYELGFYGIMDLVNFYEDENGIYMPTKGKSYIASPVEYKAGKPKGDPYDEVQLCLQAMCLEEMLRTPIEEGYFYYAKIKRRIKVVFDKTLRNLVSLTAKEMHTVFQSDQLPALEHTAKCKHCSLANLCMPSQLDKFTSVDLYLNKVLHGKGGE